MKIRSITDVITNSSTEVFLLETSKSVEEVSEILRGITTGYNEPEILEGGCYILGILKEYGYLFRKDSQADQDKYMIKILGYDDIDWEFQEDSTSPPGFKDLHGAWEDWIWDHREYLDSILARKTKHYPQGYLFKIPKDFLHRYVESKYLPHDFLQGFIDGPMKGIIPEYLRIPDNLTLEYWEGKMAFKGEGDNSVPYEDWEKIHEAFGGIRFHLG